MQPVNAAHRGQTKIRHHKPLPRRTHNKGVHARNSGLQRVNPGWHAFQGIIHRQPCGDIKVHLLPHLCRTSPQHSADRAFEIFFLILLHRGGEIVFLNGAQQVAVGHLV